MELKKWGFFADAVPSSPLAAGPHVADTGRRIACTDVAVRPGGAVADRAGSPGRDAGRDNVRDDATARVPAGARGARDMSSAQRPASSCPPGPAMPRLRARSRRGCFPLLQRGLAAVLRRNVPVPDASPEAESGGAGRPGALAGRVRRAAALVFCASLAAPLLGAGGSAEAQNTPDTTPPTLTSADVEETNGLSIYLEFSEDLQLSNPPPASAFTLTVDGSAVTGFSVAWQGSLLPQNAIWLVLPTAIRQGQVVVVTYEDPTAGDDANAIQDTAGNDAATFTTGMDGVPAVTNNSTVTNTPATGAPTITGTAQVGQTLTAGTTAIMDDDGLTSVSYTYQWIRTAAGVDTNISGATASTYTLVAADQGTTVKVRVSFTDDASKAETRTSAATAAVSAAPNTPATGAPTITGTAQVGQTLTAGTTAIVDADGLTSVSYTYQWIRVATDNTETNISGATASTHTLVAADQGTTIKVTVSFTDDASNAETLTSAATAAVAAAPNTPATGAPTITGTAQVGQTLTAGTTAIVDADGLTSVSYTYQWIRVDGGTETNISGATASTYTLVAADQGTTVKVRVSFTDDASNAETRTSAATAAVSAAANTPATGAPTITGTAQVGQTLTAGTTAIMDADGLTAVQAIGLYKFQWIRVATDNSETNIASATVTYTLVAADQGTTIKVTVSFTDDANNPETLTSAATAAVAAAANTPATGAPTITGTAQVGQTLTAGTTAIMDADGLTTPSYTYQWIRVATDNTETNISGATASTHTLVAADQGTTIKVTVSFTDDASNPETRTSAATAAVAAEVTGTPEPEPFEVEIVGVPEVAVTGESYELTVQSDEDSLVYAWRVDGGAIEPDDVQMVVWTAPETAGVAWIHVDVTREDGAKAGQSAYVRVEVPEPEPEPVPALPLLGQLLLALGLAGAGAMRLVRSARRP